MPNPSPSPNPNARPEPDPNPNFSIPDPGPVSDPNQAVVSAELLQLERHGALLAPGSAPRAALQEKGRALNELPADTKDDLLRWSQAHTRRRHVTCLSHTPPATHSNETDCVWSQAHAVLLQIFGPREQVERLQAAPGNAYHFTKLARYAAAVAEQL